MIPNPINPTEDDDDDDMLSTILEFGVADDLVRCDEPQRNAKLEGC